MTAARPLTAAPKPAKRPLTLKGHREMQVRVSAVGRCVAIAARGVPDVQQRVPAGYRFEVLIPGLRLVTLSNGPAFARFQKAKVSREQKALVTACLQSRAVRCPLLPPLTVTITRGAPGRFDSDNLVTSAKYIRDAVAAYLNVNDRHDHLVEYVVKQHKTAAKTKTAPAEYWCKIEIARRG